MGKNAGKLTCSIRATSFLSAEVRLLEPHFVARVVEIFSEDTNNDDGVEDDDDDTQMQEH